MITLTENLFSGNKEVEASRQRVAILTQNVTYLSQLSSNDVSKYVVLANDMFPRSKDFNGAMQAINASAVAANISIDSLTFQVGDISGNANIQDNASNALQLSISLQGDDAGIAQFLQSLEEKVPLISVQSVSMEQDTAVITIQVAYKPYTEKNIDLTSQALYLSPQTVSLLQQAAQWQNAGTGSVPVSSTSASLPPF